MSLVSAHDATVTLAAKPPQKTKRTHWGNSINGLRSPSPEPRSAKRARTAAAGLRTPESEIDDENEVEFEFQKESVKDAAVPETQTVLLLREIKTKYEIVEGYETPKIADGKVGEDEVVIEVLFVGLNPIDWKAP